MLSSQEELLQRVVSLVEELQTGSGPVTSKDTDFLGADDLPTVLETGELRDL